MLRLSGCEEIVAACGRPGAFRCRYSGFATRLAPKLDVGRLGWAWPNRGGRYSVIWDGAEEAPGSYGYDFIAPVEAAP